LKNLKEKIFKNFPKEDQIVLLIIVMFSMIFCNAFLQMHYASDTYVLMDLGYENYPSKYFLVEGRVVSSLVCYTAGFLNLKYDTYIVAMDFIGIILISISIFILYKNLIKMLIADTILNRILILASTFVLLLNQFILEYLLFPESAVMCLSLLLGVIAATKVISDDKYKYIKIAILAFFTIYCYQTTATIFFILSILLIFINQFYNKKTFKETIKVLIKNVIILFLILLIIMISNIAMIKLIGFQKVSDRILEPSNFSEEFKIRVDSSIKELKFFWNQSRNLLPTNFNSLILISTLMIMVLSSKVKKLFWQYAFIILVIVLATVSIVFLTNTGACVRLHIHVALFWGISLIYLIIIKNDIYSEKIKNLIIGIILFSFMFNGIMLIRNTTEHVAASKIDNSIGNIVLNLLEEYERESGYKVTKFSYIYDGYNNPVSLSAPGIRDLGSLTERKFACGWCVESAMEFFCKREFEAAVISEEYINVYEDWIAEMRNTNCNVFSEKQVLFIEDNFFFWN